MAYGYSTPPTDGRICGMGVGSFESPQGRLPPNKIKEGEGGVGYAPTNKFYKISACNIYNNTNTKQYIAIFLVIH